MSSTLESRRARAAVGPSAAGPTLVRPEIQGLRAIAVALVVVFHLWPDRLPGGYLGVDVFFVISGYLITAHLVRESDRTGRVALGAFWARRARRLLPAAYVVLAASLVAVVLWVPRVLWQQFVREIGAAALYVENWVLAADAVDYLAADNVASPAQHYWTLSAEEQFYLVWPLLVVAGLWLAPVLSPRLGPRRRQRMAVSGVLAAVTVLSFAYSLHLTASDPARSYFVTTTRAWEFGAGAVLAFAPVLAGRRHARAAVSWTGVVILAVCALRMTEATPMPGTAAAWVVAGTAAVLWAGHPEVGWSPTRALAWRPSQIVGDLSYSIYLWHWPLIVILPYATRSTLGTLDKLTIAVTTLVLAWATKRWVEDPVRTGRRFGLRRSWVTFAGAAAGAGVLVAGCLVGWSVVERDNELRAAGAEALLTQHGSCFGAASRDPARAAVCPDPALAAAIIPDPSNVREDHATYEWCGAHLRGKVFEGCPFGTPRRGVPHVAVIGDSHARALMPMFEILVQQGVLTAEMFSAPGCAWSTVPPAAGNTRARKRACATLKANIDDLLRNDADRFDLIVTTNRGSSQRASDEERVQGLLDVWEPALDAGVPIAAVRDNPDAGRLPEDDPNLCLGQVGAARAGECAMSRKAAVTDRFDPYEPAVARVGAGRAVFIDLTRWYCDDVTCPVVVGGANVYRDSNHVSITYAQTMAPYYLEAFRRAGLLGR